jgi:hypothetical protein
MSSTKNYYYNDFALSNTELAKRRKIIHEKNLMRYESKFMNRLFMVISCFYVYCWLMTLIIIYYFK